MRKTLTLLAAAALVAAVFAPPASAQTWSSTRPLDRSTFLTFSGPVSLPDVTLPAGTYLFRFVDPATSPGVLQVLSRDEQTVYAMLHTTPIVRIETESNNAEVVTFHEAPADTPPSIATWYFDATETAPGNADTGCELIYTK